MALIVLKYFYCILSKKFLKKPFYWRFYFCFSYSYNLVQLPKFIINTYHYTLNIYDLICILVIDCGTILTDLSAQNILPFLNNLQNLLLLNFFNAKYDSLCWLIRNFSFVSFSGIMSYLQYFIFPFVSHSYSLLYDVKICQPIFYHFLDKFTWATINSYLFIFVFHKKTSGFFLVFYVFMCFMFNLSVVHLNKIVDIPLCLFW